MDARRTSQLIFRVHPPDQRAQFSIDLQSASKGGDFRRQYRRKPARCQRTRVSGRMIVMVFSTDGNHRYSMTIRELDATAHPPPQHNQLKSECRDTARALSASITRAGIW
jgi:hypothetical protein